jgi:hypothetical protein
VVQPFQKQFTPLAGVTFQPVEIKQFRMKVGAQEYPDELEATWLGFLDSPEVDRKAWPFVRWYVEVYLIPQIKQDIELNEIYQGVYAAPEAGTPGAAGTSMDGLKITINRHIANGLISPIATGTVETDPQAHPEPNGPAGGERRPPAQDFHRLQHGHRQLRPPLTRVGTRLLARQLQAARRSGPPPRKPRLFTLRYDEVAALLVILPRARPGARCTGPA